MEATAGGDASAEWRPMAGLLVSWLAAEELYEAPGWAGALAARAVLAARGGARRVPCRLARAGLGSLPLLSCSACSRSACFSSSTMSSS